MPPSTRILMLEDSVLDAELVTAALEKGGLQFTCERVENRQDYVAALDGAFDLILSDFSLPSFDGMTALSLAREHAPETPFIFVSGVLGEEFAIDSLKQGATDYVLKQRLARLPTAVSRALAEATERRERRLAEERMRLLVAELSHRVKNTLATVTSMAKLTLKRSETLKDFEERFMSRLQALSEANTLIFRANWGQTDIREVLERALKPFRGLRDGFHLDGGPVSLPPKPALSLTLMIHELATNACKYGALSKEGGEVRVSWSVADGGSGPQLRLDWVESGGPQVSAPSRKGFGHTLIERSTSYELDGEATVSFPPEGVRAMIRFPVLWPN